MAIHDMSEREWEIAQLVLQSQFFTLLNEYGICYLRPGTYIRFYHNQTYFEGNVRVVNDDYEFFGDFSQTWKEDFPAYTINYVVLDIGEENRKTLRPALQRDISKEDKYE